MDSKLTLKLDKYVIDKAKNYASTQKRSLSRIIESYLRSLINKDQPEGKDDFEISPFVRNMATGIEIPDDFDYKDEYRNHLKQKYQ